MAALSTPQVCWMLTSVRLKADAIVISRCVEKHGGIRFPWKVEGTEEIKRFLGG